MGNHLHGGDVYRHKDMLDFSSNCNPLGTSPKARQAAIDAAQNIFHYPDVECQELRRAISDHSHVAQEHIICGNGAADLIFALALAVKPKKALIPAPTFAEYRQALQAAGCQVNSVMVGIEQEHQELFLDAITEDVDMVFWCNPNNPTGGLATREFLLEVLDRCSKAGAVLALDECFMDFVTEGDQYTMKEQLLTHKNLFILKAFTKLYGMAGLRLGYGLCSDTDLMKKIGQVTQPWRVSTVAQQAGIAALHDKDYVSRGLEIIRRERSVLVNGLSQLGFKVYAPKANYVFFRGAKGLAEKCIDKGILIRDCSNYEGLEEGYYRVAVKLPEENQRLLQALGEIVDDMEDMEEDIWQR